MPRGNSLNHRPGLVLLRPPTDRELAERRPKIVPPRSFAIGDLMIIVAGAALGCAWTRANWFSSGKQLVKLTWDSWRYDWQTAIQLPTPLLFSLGFAALLCRFLPPRPPLGQIARQPGVVALAILAFVLAVNVVFQGVSIFIEIMLAAGQPDGALVPAIFLLPNASELFIYQVMGTCPTLIVCWTLQQIIDPWAWTPERSWIDRTGRTLGVCLIVLEVFWLAEWFTRPD